MRRVITHRFVEAVQPKTKRAEYPDAGCPGLYLIVQPSGTRSWAVRFRRNGANGKHTLGRAGEGGLTLAAARAAAAAHRHRLEERPVGPVVGVAAVAAIPGEGGGSIEVAIASFLELHARRKTRASTALNTERIFNRTVLPAWRGRAIGDIRKRDVIDLVEGIAASGHGCRATKPLAVLPNFFNWRVARDELALSPVMGVERPYQEKERERVLTDSEVCALWAACAGNGPFDPAFKLMLLTGARRAEVSNMEFRELDDERHVWTLPAVRAKNKRECEFPLSAQAWALIQGQP